MHFAVHGRTAAEVVYYRANADQPHMGLTSWRDAPLGKIMKSDVSIAKNYLTEDELYSLERIVSALKVNLSDIESSRTVYTRATMTASLPWSKSQHL